MVDRMPCKCNLIIRTDETRLLMKLPFLNLLNCKQETALYYEFEEASKRGECGIPLKALLSVPQRGEG